MLLSIIVSLLQDDGNLGGGQSHDILTLHLSNHRIPPMAQVGVSTHTWAIYLRAKHSAVRPVIRNPKPDSGIAAPTYIMNLYYVMTALAWVSEPGAGLTPGAKS